MANDIVIKEDAAIAIAEKFDMAELIKPLQKEILLFDTYIAGTSHLEDPSVLEEIKTGEKVIFLREPDNRFDDNAIQILTEDNKRLGYVPEKDNIIFARLMDAGKKLTGKINGIKKKQCFIQVAIGIYLVDF